MKSETVTRETKEPTFKEDLASQNTSQSYTKSSSKCVNEATNKIRMIQMKRKNKSANDVFEGFGEVWNLVESDYKLIKHIKIGKESQE
jgi:hypothetical protein